FCGQDYRVLFDLTPPDWNLPRGMRCVDCGTEHRMTEVEEGRSPWLPLNEWQMRCNQCVQWSLQNGRVRIEPDERGGQFVRFSSDHSRAEVQAFVAQNSLRVDWSKAYIASTGSIGTPRFTRRIEFWRLPITGVGGYERRELERLVDTAKTFEKFYGMARPSPRKQELRNRFDHTLRQLVLALETELDHPAPEAP